jgi:hypothetical protein
MANNKFEITILGRDQFTPVAKKVRAQFEGMMAPAKRLNRETERMSEGQGKALDRLGSSLGHVGKIGRDLANNFAPAASLLGIASAAGVAKFASNWSQEGFSALRGARTIGVDPSQLQGLRGAAELSGLDPNAAEGNLAALAGSLQNARYGRNDQLRSFMQAKGMGFQYKRDGTIDTMAMLKEVSRLLANQNDPQAQDVVAGMFGVQDIAPMLRDGPASLDALQAEAKKAGLVRDEQQLKKNEQFNNSVNRLWGSVKGLVGTTLDKHSPDITGAMERQANENEESVRDLRGQMHKGGATGSWATGGANGSWGSPSAATNPARSTGSQAPTKGSKDSYSQGGIPDKWYVPPRSQSADAFGILQQELSKATDPADRAAIARELSRMGATPQPGSPASAPQQVEVQIEFKNAPPGTSANWRYGTSPSVHKSMDGLGAGQ